MSEPQNPPPSDEQPERPPIPTVDELVPLWRRETGRGGRLNQAERAARDANRAQRAAAEALICRSRQAEAQLTDMQRALNSMQASMQASYDQQAALRAQAEAELQAVRGNLSIIVQVATQVAAAAGSSVAGVDYDHQYSNRLVRDVRVSYWLAGSQLPVFHDVSQGVLIHGGGREEARFELSSNGGISEAWQRALRAFHWRREDCDYCGRRANH